jgi:hypothetical protein
MILSLPVVWRNNHKPQTQFVIILAMLIQGLSNQAHMMSVLVSELKLSL